MDIRRIDQTNRKQIDAFIVRQWYTLQMIVHGESIDLGTADGFYACDGDEIIGLITWKQFGNEIEILTLSIVFLRLMASEQPCSTKSSGKQKRSA